MNKSVNIFILAFYTLGTLFLPLGDFSTLVDLPEMYNHCKATEDKDMTFMDFITDHLVNLDCLIDQHDNGDEQKPHSPIQYHHQDTQNYFYFPSLKVVVSRDFIIQSALPIYKENIHLSNYLAFIFHPPIV